MPLIGIWRSNFELIYHYKQIPSALRIFILLLGREEEVEQQKYSKNIPKIFKKQACNSKTKQNQKNLAK